MARLTELFKIVKSLSQQEKAELIAFLSSDNNSSANCESGFNFIKQTSSCPHCKSNKIVKNGFRNSIQRFICKDCNKSFTVRTNTITEHSKKSFETWSKYLNNYLVWNNFVNYAKESYNEKEQILTDFIFTTEKKILCKNIPVRNPIPVRMVG